MEFIADTTLLIDLQREARHGTGRASSFVKAHAQDAFSISVVSVAEFGAGYGESRRAEAEVFLRLFAVVPIDTAIAWRFAAVYRALKESGRLIGGNDLWIAGTCLALGRPLVTRNVDDFKRVAGLSVIGY